MCKLTKVGDLQIFKRKNPFKKLDRIIGLMFLELGKDSKVFETIYFSRIFLSIECLHVQFTKREWAKRANPCASWYFFKSI